MENEYQVCTEGEVLGSGQTTLLKMFGVATAEFGVNMRAYWTAESGEVVTVEEGGGGGMEIDEDEEVEA